MTLRTLFTFALLSLVLQPTHAQSNRGTVTGVVTDASDRPLPGVQVVDQALQRGTTTDADGRYRIEGLPTGTHTLEFRFVGYQTAVRTVAIGAGETATVDVVLQTQVLETEGVTAATYDMNPEQSGGQTEPILSVKTDGRDPLEALEDASGQIRADTEAFLDAYQSAA